MSLAKTVVSRPTTIFIVFVLLIMLGVFAFINLPIDLMPEINPPYLMVMCSYPGAGPEEVERSITRALEVAVSSVSSLEKMTSSSSKGSGIVFLEFTYGTDLAFAEVPITAAQTLMGHSDISTTAKFYTHWTTDELKKANKKLEAYRSAK